MQRLPDSAAMSLPASPAGEAGLPFAETVQQVDVGISIYDASLRLIFCNPSFRRIFALPEEQVPLGSPLAPIVRRLAERGAYGNVNVDAFVEQLLATLRDLDQPLIMERTVIDGRVFESNTSRLAGGGCLAIHTDITHHKQTLARLQDSRQQLAAQQALLQTSIDNMPGALAVWDKEMRYLLWSRHGEEFFNIPAGTLKVGMPLEEVVRLFAERGDYGPGDIEMQVAEQMRPFYERASLITEREMPDGRVIQSHRTPLPDGGYVSVFHDISAQKTLEIELRRAKEKAEAAADALQRSRQQIKALLDSSGQGFLSFGPNLRVNGEYSRACLSMLDNVPAGKPITRLLHPDDKIAAAQLAGALGEVFAAKSKKRALLDALPREFERGERLLQADFRPLDDNSLMLVLTDVTAERKLMRLSNTDRLTGIPNRRKLDEQLAGEHERALRSGQTLALILADIDHFKSINDNFGHQTGDRVLIDVANTLRDRVRKSDMLGRWGGEEFMIICPHTDATGALYLAEELRQAIANIPSELGRPLSCSFGIAILDPEESVEILIRRADDALYAAKNRGRNCVRLASVP